MSACSSSKPAQKPNTLVSDSYAKTLRLFDKKQYSDALIGLEPLRFTSRGTALEGEVLFLLAKTYYYTEQYYLAADTFNRLLQQIPSTPHARSALFMIGKSYEKISPGPELDQQVTAKAIEQYGLYLELYPVPDSSRISADVEKYRELVKINPSNQSYKEGYAKATTAFARIDTLRYAARIIPRLREKLAANLYGIAHQYVQLKKYKSAGIYYDEIIKRYPDTGYLQKAWSGKIDVLVRRKKWFDASQAIDQYLQAFPGREKEIGPVRERVMKNFSNN
ncbi:MAG: outer membrane protein assembly factor BamD [Chlorobiaceae bacterium]